MNTTFRFYLLVFCVLTCTTQVWAQFPGSNRNFGGGRNSGSQIDTAQREAELDTFKIFYYHPQQFFREKPFKDSLLGNYTHQLDPARMRAYDYQNLGVVGSPAQPIVYQGQFMQGFDVGLHQFNIYRRTIDSLRFYRVERSFTNTEYDRGGDQADARIMVQFARNFSKGTNLSLDYERITQTASRIQFSNQRARNTAFNIGLTIQGESGRYKGFIGFSSNKNEQEENGGLVSEPTIGGQFTTPSEAAVQTETARTVYRYSAFQYNQFFNLRKPVEPAPPTRPPIRRPTLRPTLDSTIVGRDSTMAPPDSIQRRRDSLMQIVRAQRTADSLANLPARKPGIFSKQEFLLSHTIRYEQNTYKFFETNPTLNTAFYENLLTDIRGLRYYLEHRKLENSFSLLTFKPEERSNQLPQDSRGLLELGLTHKLHFLRQETGDSTINNLFLTGKWHYLPTKFLRLETAGHLGILDNVGDFRAEASLTLDLGGIGILSGKFVNQLSEPSLIYGRWQISEVELWRNPLRKTLSNQLEATYAIPQRHFSVTGTYHLVNNMVYFDTLGQAQQSRATVNILQLAARKRFRIGKIFLDNQLVFQTSSEDFVRLPELFGKHSLYYKDVWFKNILDIKIGLDVRYRSAYFSETYNPVIGNFHLQDQQELRGFVPLADFHLGFRIEKFRAYVRLENLRNVFGLFSHPTETITDPNTGEPITQVRDLTNPDNWRFYYPTAFYPFPNATGLRIGVKWRFLE
ncbi:MAG: putative porin [Bacteroidota bacterium]